MVCVESLTTAEFFRKKQAEKRLNHKAVSTPCTFARILMLYDDKDEQQDFSILVGFDDEAVLAGEVG